MAVGARKLRDYGFYVSMTQPQADDHLTSIEPKLGADAVRAYYPDLSERHVGLHGSGTHWRRQRLWTKRGLIIDALGIDTAARGRKLGDQRPSLIIFDDIDDKDESAIARKKKMETMKSDIIGAASHDAMIIFIQNKVHRDSIMSQIIDGRADLLADAIIEGPYSALGDDFKYETKTVNDDNGYSRQQHTILAGTPIWEGQNLEDCQGQLNNMGLDSFLREVQQDVERAPSGAVLGMFEEPYSVITRTEFQLAYGRPATDQSGDMRIPAVGYLANFQDVGSTVGHPNANVWAWRPEQGMRFSDSVFCYRELTMPEYPDPRTLDPSPLTVAMAIHRLEAPWQEGENHRMIRRISHEKPDWVNFYNMDLPRVNDPDTGRPLKALRYGQWSPVKSGGLGTLQSYMAVIERDHSELCPHKMGDPRACSQWLHAENCPHRADHRQTTCWARPNVFRPWLWGRSRFILIVEDDQGSIEPNGKQRQPYDARGFARLRAEIARYTEEKLKGGPAKIFDDMVDTVLKLAENFFIPIARPKEEDQIQAAIPEVYRKDAPQELVASLNDLAKENYAQIQYVLEADARARVSADRKASQVYSHGTVRRGRG